MSHSSNSVIVSSFKIEDFDLETLSDSLGPNDQFKPLGLEGTPTVNNFEVSQLLIP